jgi:hypothetical protein
MSYLHHIKRANITSSERWIVKYHEDGLVREVKQVYNPSEYYAMNKHKGENARSLHNKNILIKILEKDKIKRKKI